MEFHHISIYDMIMMGYDGWVMVISWNIFGWIWWWTHGGNYHLLGNVYKWIAMGDIYIENHLKKNMNFHGLSSSSWDLQMVKGWEYKLGVRFIEFYHASAFIIHSCPMIYKLDILGWYFSLLLTMTQWHSCAGPSKNTCRRANKRQNTRVDQGRARQRGKGTWF
jgi:hypothetical protein